MEDKPLVSICIPTFNSSRYLKQCLDSIVCQTYKNVEVIISDNASTDGTVTILREYVNKYGYKLHSNTTNIGGGANFNKLIGLARGKYVAIYHSDDVYENTIVEESVGILEQNESVGLVGTMGRIINDEGTPFSEMKLPTHLKKMHKTIYSFDEALSGILKRGWFFVTPSIMARKKIYDELGVFDLQHFGSSGDYELWLRIANKFDVAIIDKPLINYRVHKNQGTELEVRRNPEIADIVLTIQKYKKLTSNYALSHQCDDCINANIIKAARRQNYYGLYRKSNQTLVAMKSNNLMFLFHKYGIKLFNLLNISLKKRTLTR